ncbi:MAG: LTA synthase family protein, partial [Bacillota bacterium]
MIVFLFPLIKKLRGRTVLFVFFTVFTLLFLGNFWYGRYFGDYLSYTDMTMGQGVEGLNPVKVFLFQIVKFQDIIFLIDLCLLGFLLRRIGSKKYSFDWGREYGGRKIKFAGGIFILLLFVAQIVVVGGFMETRNPAELYAHDTAGFVNT